MEHMQVQAEIGWVAMTITYLEWHNDLPYSLRSAIGACEECDFLVHGIELCDDHEPEVRNALHT